MMATVERHRAAAKPCFEDKARLGQERLHQPLQRMLGFSFSRSERVIGLGLHVRRETMKRGKLKKGNKWPMSAAVQRASTSAFYFQHSGFRLAHGDCSGRLRRRLRTKWADRPVAEIRIRETLLTSELFD
jgi:hypothetical protein